MVLCVFRKKAVRFQVMQNLMNTDLSCLESTTRITQAFLSINAFCKVKKQSIYSRVTKIFGRLANIIKRSINKHPSTLVVTTDDVGHRKSEV